MIRQLYNTGKYLLWTVAGMAVTVLLILVAVFGFVQTEWAKKRIALRIEQAYAEALNSDLHVGALRGVLPARMVLEDVEILSRLRTAHSSDTVATIRRLEASLDLWGLLRGQINVTGLLLEEPFVRIHPLPDGRTNLSAAFMPIGPQGEPFSTFIPETLQLYAPSVHITDGKMLADASLMQRLQPDRARHLLLDSLQAAFFIELSSTQRFLEINTLGFRATGEEIEHLQIAGQLFNDQTFLELNRFRVRTDRSDLLLNVELQNVDANNRESIRAIREAPVRFSLIGTAVHPQDISFFVDSLPPFVGPFTMSVRGNGKPDSLHFDQLRFSHGTSLVEADGELGGLISNALRFDANLETANISKEDLSALMPQADTLLVHLLADVNLTGQMSGTSDSLALAANVLTPAGAIEIFGGISLDEIPSYLADITADALDFRKWADFPVEDTYLTINGNIEGRGFDRAARLRSRILMTDGSFEGIQADTLQAFARFDGGTWFPDVRLISQAGDADINGEISFYKREPEYLLNGTVRNLNIAAILPDTTLPQTAINAHFETVLRGAELDDLHGRMSLDMAPSVVGADTLRGIQGYADLTEGAEGNRTFRLTSTILDLQATGTLPLNQLRRHVAFWTAHTAYQIRKEVLLNADEDIDILVPQAPTRPVTLSFDANVKDLSTISKLVPPLEEVFATAHIQGSFRADAERLLLNVSIDDDSTRYAGVAGNNVRLGITAALRSDQTLRESANLQIQASLGTLWAGGTEMDGVVFSASMMGDSLEIENTINRIGKSARARYRMEAVLGDSLIDVRFPAFYLGNEQYAWSATGDPHIQILPGGALQFMQFRFENEGQTVDIAGIFSEDPNDRLHLNMKDVDLEKISDLLVARVEFNGILNGEVQTGALRTQTNLEGHIHIDAFAINKRTVGDLHLDSRFNPDFRRFDTRLEIKTDSLKYDEYFEKNNGIGQDIVIEGFLSPENLNPDAEDLFYFDVNVNEIDLWVIRFVLLSIFNEVEGRASGSGYIRGDMESFRYESTFQLTDTFVKPVFLNTNYTLNGPLHFNSTQGLVLDNISVRDDKSGSGTLSGTVDMNDFKPEKFLDLSLRLNRLEFLNNGFDEDVPFYGRVSGTGSIRLAGPSTRPFVQTTRPIAITPNSKLTIPLLDQGAINQQTNFIRFVNEFFELDMPEAADGTTIRDIPEKTFMDIFQLDLQFNMPQDAAIEFVFDPVTNEYLTTRGSGSVRITVENGNLGMFGSFDIDRGEYNFVGGDIFSKKFKIESGGTVIWDGIAQDPQIAVSAFYSARPNLEPLGTGRNMRVPIDLILKLNGRMASLENDFYFAYPSNFDAGLSASELNILNGEDQKLLQATSLLITGNFLPVNTGMQSDANLQNRMTQAGIGQLLSSQINYLLNSSLRNFDFDLNLTGFDQADLGIGLRLFDDRLELRRDGTIVGDQSNIGDLAATYRINRFLSVEVFHRQDLSQNRNITQEGTVDRVNGIGIQYQVQFGSWRKFLSDIWNFLKGIAG